MTEIDGGDASPKVGGVRFPVARKLFRAAFLLYLGAAVAITAAFVAEAWFSARGDLKRELSNYRRTMEEALAAPLWSVDIESVRAISVGMLEIPGIAGVRITDHTGTREFVAVGQPTRATGWMGTGWMGGPITVEFPVHYSHAVGRDLVGRVALAASPLTLAERLQWRIALIVVSAILKTAILWLIFDRLGRSILARPLARLTGAVRLAGGGRLEPVEFDRDTAVAAEGTEIEELRLAYNDMVASLRRTHNDIAVLNRELENRVAERTLALEARAVELSAAVARADQARRQAAAALEVAQRAGRAKSEFLALVSHELRTPLNSILGFAELLRGKVGLERHPERLPEYADAIHTSGSHLLTLINDILDLSKIEAGQMQIHPEWIDPAPAARTVVELMREQAMRKGVTIECQVDPAIGPLRADPRRYRQMLINLLSNAVKFTEAGGTVTVAARVTPEDWLAISVTDTGIGMRSQDIAKALEPFGQVDDPATRTQLGTGLGLPLVARMARLHGGRLAVDSARGVGTTATIWFPPDSRRGVPAAMRRN